MNQSRNPITLLMRMSVPQFLFLVAVSLSLLGVLMFRDVIRSAWIGETQSGSLWPQPEPLIQEHSGQAPSDLSGTGLLRRGRQQATGVLISRMKQGSARLASRGLDQLPLYRRLEAALVVCKQQLSACMPSLLNCRRLNGSQGRDVALPSAQGLGPGRPIIAEERSGGGAGGRSDGDDGGTSELECEDSAGVQRCVTIAESCKRVSLLFQKERGNAAGKGVGGRSDAAGGAGEGDSQRGNTTQGRLAAPGVVEAGCEPFGMPYRNACLCPALRPGTHACAPFRLEGERAAQGGEVQGGLSLYVPQPFLGDFIVSRNGLDELTPPTQSNDTAVPLLSNTVSTLADEPQRLIQQPQQGQAQEGGVVRGEQQGGEVRRVVIEGPGMKAVWKAIKPPKTKGLRTKGLFPTAVWGGECSRTALWWTTQQRYSLLSAPLFPSVPLSAPPYPSIPLPSIPLQTPPLHTPPYRPPWLHRACVQADSVRGRVFQSCAVVGESAALLALPCGAHIDRHEAIFRVGAAAARPWSSFVGSRTSIRVVGPEEQEGAREVKREMVLVAVQSERGMRQYLSYRRRNTTSKHERHHCLSPAFLTYARSQARHLDRLMGHSHAAAAAAAAGGGGGRGGRDGAGAREGSSAVEVEGGREGGGGGGKEDGLPEVSEGWTALMLALNTCRRVTVYGWPLSEQQTAAQRGGDTLLLPQSYATRCLVTDHHSPQDRRRLLAVLHTGVATLGMPCALECLQGLPSCPQCIGDNLRYSPISSLSPHAISLCACMPLPTRNAFMCPPFCTCQVFPQPMCASAPPHHPNSTSHVADGLQRWRMLPLPPTGCSPSNSSSSSPSYSSASLLANHQVSPQQPVNSPSVASHTRASPSTSIQQANSAGSPAEGYAADGDSDSPLDRTATREVGVAAMQLPSWMDTGLPHDVS
ncbi:unnamed protein product [Closterium sp. NIES-64]|nr:unnamed protein product [Closterium sp. NIES-64]